MSLAAERLAPFQWLTDGQRNGTKLAKLRGRAPSAAEDVQMRTDDRTDLYGRHHDRSGFERLASSALEYLRSRSSEHWLMFLAGLMIGLFLG